MSRTYRRANGQIAPSRMYKVTADGQVWNSPGARDVIDGKPVVFAGSAKAARRVAKRIRAERYTESYYRRNV